MKGPNTVTAPHRGGQADAELRETSLSPPPVRRTGEPKLDYETSMDSGACASGGAVSAKERAHTQLAACRKLNTYGPVTLSYAGGNGCMGDPDQ